MEALLALLETSTLSVVYGKWEAVPALPYVVYRFTNSADLIADNVNYAERGDWQVELYSEDKDTVSEALVQDALKGAGIPYDKRETYIETQRMHQVVYLIRA